MHEKMVEWLNSIKDFKLHHMGEFYTYLTNRPWRTPGGKKRAQFLNWYCHESREFIGYPFVPLYFVVLRDNDGTDFVQRQEPGRIYKDHDDWFAFNCKGCREFFSCEAIVMEQQYQTGKPCQNRVPEWGGN